MSLYKSSPIFEEIWDNIRLLLEWQQGFGFYLVFSDNTYASLELKQRINDYLHIQSKQMQRFRPEQPTDVPQQILQTLLHKDYQNVPVWIELTAYPQEQLWTDIRQQTLNLLNRQRGLLEAHCLRAVFLQLPSAMTKDIVVYAPDLWSIRQYIAVLPNLEKQEDELTLPLHQELVMEAEQADLAVQQGEWQKALDLHRSQVEKLRVALIKQPENSQITFGLYVALTRLGSLEQKLKRYEVAKKYYQESLEITQNLYGKGKKISQNIQCYISSLSFIAELDYELSNYQEALFFYQKALVLIKEWEETENNKFEILNRSSFVFLGIARIHKKQANFSESLLYTIKLLNTILNLQKIVDNNEIRRRLSMTCDLLGDIELNIGDAETALVYYKRSLEIIRNILKINTKNSQAVRHMMICFNKIALCYNAIYLLDNVEIYYQQALIMAKKQCELIGNTPKALRDILVIKGNILDFKVKNTQDDSMIVLSDDAIKIALQLYQLSPKSLQSINDLLDAYHLRVSIEKQLNPHIDHSNLLQKIAELEQQRQQLLESH